MTPIKYKGLDFAGYCVYFLIYKNNIVYIGYTCSLGRRLAEHHQWLPFRKGFGNAIILSNGKIIQDHHYDFYKNKVWKYGLCKKNFTHYYYLPVETRRDAIQLESKKIKEYKPKYNNHRDYRWVLHKNKKIKKMPDYYLMRWEKR